VGGHHGGWYNPRTVGMVSGLLGTSLPLIMNNQVLGDPFFGGYSINKGGPVYSSGIVPEPVQEGIFCAGTLAALTGGVPAKINFISYGHKGVATVRDLQTQQTAQAILEWVPGYSCYKLTPRGVKAVIVRDLNAFGSAGYTIGSNINHVFHHVYHSAHHRQSGRRPPA